MKTQQKHLPIFLFFLLAPGALSFRVPDMAKLTLVMEQVGEIMIVCRENPTTCTCEDGSILPGHNLFSGLMSCNPTSCECPSGLTVKDLDKIVVEEVLTMEMFRRVMSLGGYMGAWSRVESRYHTFCNGNAPSSCACKNGDVMTDFVKSTSKLISCQPLNCDCGDGSAKSVPDYMRYSFLLHMGSMCDVRDCSCSSNSTETITPPFLSAADFGDCAPSTCTCMDESVKVMPALPVMETNLIEAFDEVAEKRLINLATLCSGEAPEFCSCVRTESVLTSYSNEEEVDNCYPRNCMCADGSTKPAPNRRGSFTHVVKLMDLKYGKEESVKLTNFYGSNRYRRSGQH